MAEETLTPVSLSTSGINITGSTGTALTTDGFKFLNTDLNTALILHNTTAGDLIVSIAGYGTTLGGAAFAPKLLTATASQTKAFGLFSERTPYNDASGYIHGKARSGATSLNARVIKTA